MSRWALTRALIVALSYLSITAALASIPGRALDYWYLYYSPVAIAALSFGLWGAAIASASTFFSLFAFYLRLEELARNARALLLLRLGGPESDLFERVEDAFSEITSYTQLVVSEKGQIAAGMQATQDVLYQTLLGAALITGISLLVGWLIDERRRDEALIHIQALTDELTGLVNYRYLKQALAEEIGRSRRFERQFALLMIDVDGLKQFNDAYGHPFGNTILRDIGHLLQHNVREIDTVARYGGDEFALILPETGAPGAAAAAERLRQETAKHTISVQGSQAGITVSIGAAVYPLDGQAPDELVEAADKALYQAKQAGRDSFALLARSPDNS